MIVSTIRICPVPYFLVSFFLILISEDEILIYQYVFFINIWSAGDILHTMNAQKFTYFNTFRIFFSFIYTFSIFKLYVPCLFHFQRLSFHIFLDLPMLGHPAGLYSRTAFRILPIGILCTCFSSSYDTLLDHQE